MVDETIPKKCETLYNKLNTFVESEISRDVTPQISNLNSRIDALEPNLVRVKEVSGNISSVSAGGTSTKTFTVPACPSGYGWKYFSTSTGWGTVNSVSLSGTTLTVTLLNGSNTSHDISFSGVLMYYPTTIEAEQHISISATNPYLLEGEVTDLVVSLVDEFGLPLANKSVTVSDGSSSYNGITNNNGLFILDDVEVSADTTFTATYSNVSASCKVEYCSFVDYATTSNHNDNWDGLTYMSRGTDGTTINNTGSGTLFERIKIDNLKKPTWPFSNGDLTITLNIVSVTGSDNRLRIIGETTCSGEPYVQVDYPLLSTSIGEFKMVYDSTNHTVKIYKDGTLLVTTNRALCGNLTFMFRVTAGSSIKYKDLRIKAL